VKKPKWFFSSFSTLLKMTSWPISGILSVKMLAYNNWAFWHQFSSFFLIPRCKPRPHTHLQCW